jgi:uroporphyrinogen decarboxylase
MIGEKQVEKTDKPVLDVLCGNVPERRPVWLMRQAGRYLPEYRDLRAKAENFLNLCLTPAWAGEITMQPVRRFDFDAAILFADILLIPFALGQKLEFPEGEGPALETVDDEKGIARLNYDDRKLLPVYETLDGVKSQLREKTTLIGFCGAPWTVACYMIDGNSRANFAKARSWVKEQPESLAKLVDILVSASEDYLSRQIEAGAEALQIFDSWAGLLSAEDFRRWVIEPTQKLATRMKSRYPHIPIIGFPREAGDSYRPYILETGLDAVSIDQHVDLDYATRELQTVKPLQGNLDPELLLKGGADMKAGLGKIMNTFGNKHIINLGHGVLPQTPPEHVAELVKFARNFKADA